MRSTASTRAKCRSRRWSLRNTAGDSAIKAALQQKVATLVAAHRCAPSAFLHQA
jgi:hypothetical protein